MTADELARLKELEAKATKNWVVAESYVGSKKHPFLVRGGEDGIRLWDDQCLADFECVAALRNAAPALIARAEWAIEQHADVVEQRENLLRQRCIAELDESHPPCDEEHGPCERCGRLALLEASLAAYPEGE